MSATGADPKAGDSHPVAVDVQPPKRLAEQLGGAVVGVRAVAIARRGCCRARRGTVRAVAARKDDPLNACK